MLKRLGVSFIFVMLQIAPFSPHAQAQPASHPKNAQPHQQPEPQPTIFNNANNRQSYEECGKKDAISPIKEDDYARKGFIVNSIIAGITLIIAIAALIQASAANKQASHIVASERAWILIGKIGNPPYLYSPELPHFVPGVVFNFQVCGKTPAKLTNGNFRMVVVPRKGSSIPPIPDLPDVPEYSGPTFPEFFPEVGTVLTVGEPINISVIYKSSLAQTEIDDMMNFKNFLCAYGFIEYEDIFGNQAKTQIGYIYDFALGGVFQSPDGTVLNPPGFRKGGPTGYNKTT